MLKKSAKKIALVFDWLDDNGGMEQVNLSLAELFPDAPIFTSVYDATKFPQLKHRVKTSWLQKLPRKLRPKHQLLAPLMPFAFRLFNLSAFDTVLISASSGYSKCVRKNHPHQKHICYCHTPIRYLYHARNEYEQDYPLPPLFQFFRFLLPFGLNWFTKIDQKSAEKIDNWIANSDFISKRIQKYYHQESSVIYPGINNKYFVQEQKNNPKEKNYFLAIGRFIPYKKFDLLVETFAHNGLPLKLAGTGPELEKAKKSAEKFGAKNIKFLGFVPDENLTALYQNARVFLFPAEEDFGLTPVEAMATGTPVIYYNAGGAVESVGDSGVAFSSQTIQSLQSAVDMFIKCEQKFTTEKLQKRARKFSNTVFQKNILAFVTKHG